MRLDSYPHVARDCHRFQNADVGVFDLVARERRLVSTDLADGEDEMRSIDTLGPAKPYAEIEQLRAERDALRAKLEKAKEALLFYADPFGVKDECGDEVRVPDFYDEMSFGDKAASILSELSADAPAQISDDVRSLLDEAIAALTPFSELLIGRFMTNGLRYDYRLDAAWLRNANAALAKLREARNENR